MRSNEDVPTLGGDDWDGDGGVLRWAGVLAGVLSGSG